MVTVDKSPLYPGELMHYGVMGMKWGVRKDGKPQGYSSGKRRKAKTSSSSSTETHGKASVKPPSASSVKRAERAERKAIKKQRQKDAKNASRLSDKELDAKIERLSKEKRLKELTDSEVSPGKKFVKDVTSTSARKIAVAAVTTAAAVAVANKAGGGIGANRAAGDFYKQATKTK